ncbi:MAG: 1-acyl-sn-glycerol-3-phosphate acyltransferase, partial [Spirochaetaceae bacterium]|nr:1-acyl-sn-glycerol-3-phosphate acyltransferase [Spirochaetaceae bacterium]
MDGLSLFDKYGYLAKELENITQVGDVITAANVFQEANPGCRKIVDRMVADNLLPGSRLEGRGHFENFFDQVNRGRHGLILMEHYSTVDLPILCYLLDTEFASVDPTLSRRIVSMAGMKLNEENPAIRVWAEGFSRIVIYPSRTLTAISDPAVLERETARSRTINTAAVRALD